MVPKPIATPVRSTVPIPTAKASPKKKIVVGETTPAPKAKSEIVHEPPRVVASKSPSLGLVTPKSTPIRSPVLKRSKNGGDEMPPKNLAGAFSSVADTPAVAPLPADVPAGGGVTVPADVPATVPADVRVPVPPDTVPWRLWVGPVECQFVFMHINY